MQEILTFSVIALLLVLSPGPNGVLILKTASVQGQRASMLNICGLTTATFVHGGLSIIGLSTLLLQSAQLFLVLKLVGAIYLFYLGLKAIVASFRMKKAVETAPQHAKNSAHRAYFYEGFLTQMLNPKVSVFYLAAFPQFISAEQFSYTLAFSMVGIHAFMIFTWFSGLTLAIQRIQSSCKNSPLAKWMQRISGGAMIYFSGMLLAYK